MITLQDERDISATLVRYITGIDFKNRDLIRSCFTDKVDAEYAPQLKYATADQLADGMEKIHRDLGCTLHRLSNTAMTPTGDGVDVRTYVDALLMPKLAEGQSPVGVAPIMLCAAYYDDHFVRDGGAWKICKRLLTVVWQANEPAYM